MSWGEGSSILLEGTVRVSFSDGAQLLLRPNMDQVTVVAVLLHVIMLTSDTI